MSKLFYDIHIHSCLSPCGDDEATPANIAALANLLELDVVALTDHNTCKNCPAFMEIANSVGIIGIPGMELTVSEEFHVLCLFPRLENAMDFDSYVSAHYLPYENNKEIYGNQLIMDSEDRLIGEEEISLINATTIDFYSLAPLVEKHSGTIIPAHIDRSAFSLIATLGSVPPDCGFKCVEIKYPEAVDNLRKKHEYINQCNVIHNSDAHRLEDISLPKHFVEAEEKSAEAFLKALIKR